ncbi:MAG: type II toxin-antitoxin system RelE/ParE family toxin [Candidatus Thiodiazotropha sp. (ex Lucinoma kastoroae)]|nr:type II toxin-antitoxin system RelE/ParE family toxin [Candidatus Thiodiazotropha sp. (ex Lucinoma kastoroae)]MCU7861579.1 type II toxin-antitoxin system RelE/ParE family toxin [Candidatus Thiodiazotropha sp. (ex Lucinoma kastoroae)]
MLPRPISTISIDYIARDVPYYAESFIDQLIDASDKRQDHPRMGRCVAEANHRDDIRELIVQGYRIIYRVTTEIHVLSVTHGSRDLSAKERKPWEGE